MPPIQFKLYKPPDGLVHLVTFPDKPSWNALATKIEALYNIPHPSIGVFYIDNDGDEVTVSSEEELQDFYQSTSGQRNAGTPGLVKLNVRDLDALHGDTRFGQANRERKERATKLNARQSEARTDTYFARIRRVYDLLWNKKSLSISEEHEGVRYIAPKFSFETTAPIMIRDEYDELWQQILSRVTQNRTGDVHGMVIVGQPGIGKSLFLAYAFARALQAGIPTVLCHIRDLYCIANDEGVKIKTVIEDGYNVPMTSGTLVLIDIVGPNPPPTLLVDRWVNPGFVVQATSPQEVPWKSWYKQRGAVAWVMSTWTREEVSSLQKLRESLGEAPWTQDKDSWYTPLELYELLGPSARSCFYSVHQHLKPKTGTTLDANLLSHPLSKAVSDPHLFDNAKDFLFAVAHGSVMVQSSGFHDFFFATPDENPRPTTLRPSLKYKIPTPFLQLSIASQYRQYVKEHGLKTLESMTPIFPHIATALFEPLVLNLLVETNEGLQCTFHNKATFRLGPGLTAHHNIVDPPLLAQANAATAFEPLDDCIYVVPARYPSVDAFVVTEHRKRITLLQMTVASEHDLEPLGVQRIISMFGQAAREMTFSVVFVTPGEQGQAMSKSHHTLRVARSDLQWNNYGHEEIPVGWLDCNVSAIDSDM